MLIFRKRDTLADGRRTPSRSGISDYEGSLWSKNVGFVPVGSAVGFAAAGGAISGSVPGGGWGVGGGVQSFEFGELFDDFQASG